MNFLVTNDVECYSPLAGKMNYSLAKDIHEVGLPRLLDLYSKHDVKATFYVTGKFAELSPESIYLIKSQGHEIGCHSYSHEKNKYLDTLSYNQQVCEIEKSLSILRPVAGNIKSFRAPSLRMNENTVKALSKLKFTSDSSVCSQRFDGPFTFGSKRELKLKWLFAERKPYSLSYSNISKKGTSGILEIPISASVFTYSGDTMRRSTLLTDILTKQLFIESRITDKPITFVFHPHECLDYLPEDFSVGKQHNSFLNLKQMIKSQLKFKNFGLKSINLLDNILTKASDFGFDFISASDYQKLYQKEDTIC